MKTLLAALALGACLVLTGCFTSQAPLFSGAGEPVFGTGKLTVTTYEDGQDPDAGAIAWTANGYVDAEKDDQETLITFHRMPGGGPFSSWYVGQTASGGKDADGYMYLLYRKQGGRLYSYDISCDDLSPAEAEAAHLVLKDDGKECVATRAGDLAQAFRLLSKRKQAKSYMIAKRAN
jgi:predicted small secreted protein